MVPQIERTQKSGGAILRAKKQKGTSSVRVAAAHNKRMIQAELGAGGSIDSSRSRLNECLAGPSSPEEVAERARQLMKGAGVLHLRRDAVRAIEFIVSLAPTTDIEERAFFVDCVAWLGARFGGSDNILSADIHRDEQAPHVHVLLLPMIDGRMNGSDALGGRTKLAALHNDFHTEVVAPYGLKRAQARLQGGAKTAGASSVLRHLKRTADASLRSAVWDVTRECIERDPGPFMTALGIEATERKPKLLRSMTAIFTSKGKGSATSEAEPNRVLEAESV